MNTHFKNKTIIVTGAAGFIGFHVANALLEQGADVVGIDNINDYYDVALKFSRLDILKKHEKFTFHKVDLADKKNITAIFETSKAHYVIHLGAQAGVRYCIDNPQAYLDSNLVGQMNILEAIREFRPEHTIYASSSSVYGDIKQMPFSTDMKTDTPVSLYAATKKSCELLSHSYSSMYDIYLTGLRFFTVYGPYGRPDMAYFKFTQKILNNEVIDIYNHGNMMRDFTYINDIVEAIIACIPLERPKNETPHRVLNIGNNNPESLEKLITLLENGLNKKAIRNLLPMQTGDVKATYADIEPLAQLTSCRPKVSLEDGIDRFIQWYRAFYQ
ncbi:MAG: UDP-glucuronate 4-epimerase [Alphaproteobacteria bacterium]